ncbi:hypothetical protein B4U79_19028 [Dinothrombium tinctorium]|uniref:Tetraspanin n=1 Tax=Dinothrombium tinctorium TaxID=1965070 RepID=A0A443R0X2_9ACAR|nr:hypothetical protein B4U79_19028 [Dinothrombium tinctorium]
MAKSCFRNRNQIVLFCLNLFVFIIGVFVFVVGLPVYLSFIEIFVITRGLLNGPAVGMFVFAFSCSCISAFGFYAIFKERSLFLVMYELLVGVNCGVLLGISVFLLIYIEKAKNSALLETIVSDIAIGNHSTAVERVQSFYSCCGWRTGAEDWLNFEKYREKLPSSCCPKYSRENCSANEIYFSQPCQEVIETSFSVAFALTLSFSVGFAIFTLVVAFYSNVLARNAPQKPTKRLQRFRRFKAKS